MKRIVVLLAALPFLASAQTAPAKTIALRAARMLDVKAGKYVERPTILIQGGRIQSVQPNAAPPVGAETIDLGEATLLPGLIDCHTHLLQDYDFNLGDDDPNMLLTVAQMSTAKRALLGVKMAREDLEAGITAVRDLGNSGHNGDVALRDAINAGWLTGPRMLVSTRALAAAGGQFGALQPLAQNLLQEEYAVISGPEEARKAIGAALRRLAPACARRTASPVLAAPKAAKVVPFYSGANRPVRMWRALLANPARKSIEDLQEGHFALAIQKQERQFGRLTGSKMFQNCSRKPCFGSKRFPLRAKADPLN